MATVEQIKNKLTPRKISTPIPAKNFLSTGSTLLNLACSGKIDGGLPRGSYVLFNGDSQSGKSIISNNTLAEASINPIFNSYDLYYNNPENGLLLDVAAFFGPKLAKRIKHPTNRKGERHHSQTVEEFYYHLWDLKQSKRPFVEVLDSQDALTSNDALDKFVEEKTAWEKGKDTTGSYGMAKPKKHSQNLNWVNAYLEKTGSILIIINQTRDNIGFGSQFNPKTRSGGKALKFYAQFEFWSSVISQIKKNVNGKDRQIGTLCEIHVKKNRVNGHDVSVRLPILRKYGLDDVGSCVDFLIEEKHWQGAKKKSDSDDNKREGKESKVIIASELDLEGKRDSLIQQIEENDMEQELRLTVQKVWSAIEEQCTPIRKPRYV